MINSNSIRLSGVLALGCFEVIGGVFVDGLACSSKILSRFLMKICKNH